MKSCCVSEVKNFEASLIKTARTNILNITVDAKESLQHEDLLRYLKNALSHDIEIQIKFDKIGPYVGQQKRSISLGEKKIIIWRFCKWKKK